MALSPAGRHHRKLPVFAVLIASLTLFSALFLFNKTIQRHSLSAQLRENDVSGVFKADAAITMVVAPKSLGVHNHNAHSRQQIQFVFASWASLNRVNFVVVSNDHQVLDLATKAGLVTIQPCSGNDIEDLTYRSLFRLVEKTLPIETDIIGFSNADILFDDSLLETALAVKDFAASRGWKNFVIEGTRTNVNVPTNLISKKREHELKKRFSEGVLFQNDAQDYFIFNRGINLVWDCIPPFLLGGVYFDNWFSGLVVTRPDIEVVDATKTLRAYHLNHGESRLLSHENAASMINLMIGHDAQNYIYRGTISDAPWFAIQRSQGIEFEPRQTPPPSGQEYLRYAKCHARGKPLVKKGEINRLSE